MDFLFIELFVLGLIFGSFFNVLMERLPRGESPFHGRSHCDHCKHTLSGFDLIPLFSYLFLGGRCRYCKSSISIQNPLIELLTGVLFISVYSAVGSTFVSHSPAWAVANYIAHLIVISSFFIIFVIDFQYRIIPDELIVSSALGAVCIAFLNSTGVYDLGLRVVSSVIALLPFLGIYVFTKGKGMGFGDVKFAPVLGLFLSFPNVLVGIYLAFLTGGLVSIILVLVGNKKFGQKIAFGPFLIIGTVAAWLFAHKIIAWYLPLL